MWSSEIMGGYSTKSKNYEGVNEVVSPPSDGKILRLPTFPFQVAKSPKDNVFATCSVDTTVRVWMVKKGSSPMHTLEGHFGYVNDLAWTSDGLRLISCSFDGSVRVWDPKSGVCLHTLLDHQVCMFDTCSQGS